MEAVNGSLAVDGSEGLWAKAILRETGVSTSSCYQCLRCTNSCPVSGFMDVKPHQVVRLIQFGRPERLYESSTIWVCLSCEMCTTYCPNEIDVAFLMDYLKNTVVSSRRTPNEYEIALFHEMFLEVLERYGRFNDVKLMQKFRWGNLKAGNLPDPAELKEDLRLAWELIRRKRLRLLPERSGGAREIRRLVSERRPRVVSP